MRSHLTVALSLLLTSCASGPALHTDDALAAETLEIAVDASGRPTEIEYHVDPAAVPAAVREAMEALHPGGTVTGAEKELLGTQHYWELAKQVDGFKVEAMFHPDGRLHSQEIEVPASSVPQAVQAAVARAGRGAVRAWEEIRDGDGELVEYRAKSTGADGRDYKLLVGTDGELLGVYREMAAEIEVPVR